MAGNLYFNGQKVCPVISLNEPVISELDVTPTTSAQTITAPSGTDGYSPVNVSAVTASIDNNITAGNIKSGVSILGVNGSVVELNGSTKTINPSTSSQTVTPTSPSNGFTSVTVPAVTSSIDANITAGNIKSGVSILGVSGTVTPLIGETRSVSITSTSGNTFTPSSGKNGITSITVTPTNQAKAITPTTSSQSISVPSGYSGFGTLTVNAVTSAIDSDIKASNIKSGVSILGVSGSVIESNNTTLSVTPSTSAQSLSPSSPYNGYSSVSVSAVTSSIDNNITAGNIKNGVTILGVTGTYSGSSVSKYNITLDDLLGDTTSGTLSDPTTPFTADFSSVTTIGEHALRYKFYRLPITQADLSTVTTVNTYGLGYTFCYSDLQSIDLSNLTTTGTYAFYYAFQGSNITRLYLPKVTSVSDYALLNMANGCNLLESFEMPELEEISGTSGLESVCQNCPAIININLDKLKTITGGGGLRNMLTLATANETLRFINFKSLETMSNTNIFVGAFQRRDSLTIYYPKLTTTSFGSYNTQFNNMLQYSKDCIVFFPSSIESTIGSWSSVTSGFSGTNTTIIFYIPSRIVVTLEQTNVDLIYDGYADKENVIRQLGSTVNYVVYQESQNRAFLGKEINCTEGEERSVTVDMTTYTYNNVNVTAPSGVDIQVIYDNYALQAQEVSSGNYLLKINQTSGYSLMVGTKDDSYYLDNMTTVTTNNSDINISLSLTPRTYVSWTRPNLTADGTLGGDSFAVSSSSVSGTNYAYRAVDSSTSTYWQSAVDATYTIYNPKLLKVSSFGINWRSASYRASTIVIEGSNDNKKWKSIQTYTPASSSSITLDITNPKGYKYYRFSFTRAGTAIAISNLTITATESST